MNLKDLELPSGAPPSGPRGSSEFEDLEPSAGLEEFGLAAPAFGEYEAPAFGGGKRHKGD